ncbi:hypothetical protein QE152_g39335 [Popillia japonica]|uniref:Uncharacterized protein n=1 Tax=Popillia japonica TaxID=7064 RepID=A0AAW1HU39_POPJA
MKELINSFVKEQLGITAEIKTATKLREKIYVIELHKEDDKKQIMQNERKLRDLKMEKVCIDNDLTKKEREKQKHIRLRAQEEQRKGNDGTQHTAGAKGVKKLVNLTRDRRAVNEQATKKGKHTETRLTGETYNNNKNKKCDKRHKRRDKDIDILWKLGTWNIRSIKEEEEFDKMGLDFLTITETKRKGEEASKTTKGHEEASKTTKGHTLIHSGVKTEQRAAAGVGCLINKRHESQIVGWKAWNERILSINIGKGREEQRKTIIAVYGPNEDDKAENKDKFWEELTIAVEEAKVFDYGKCFQNYIILLVSHQVLHYAKNKSLKLNEG